ncbi:hypothetical protein RDI58_018875 [Solanum bulbocastanum]|uniref:Uncharacterized protein n=1 Tax=Solanum bulbocastanum TaxID=147425 RepID=A0AAN8TCT4_SOLBU
MELVLLCMLIVTLMILGCCHEAIERPIIRPHRLSLREFGYDESTLEYYKRRAMLLDACMISWALVTTVDVGHVRLLGLYYLSWSLVTTVDLGSVGLLGLYYLSWAGDIPVSLVQK